MNESSHEYHRRRYREETAAASSATDPVARAVHIKLAELHRREADEHPAIKHVQRVPARAIRVSASN